MSNTTVFVLCVAVPLLLGGFVNYYAHKPWILYFPLVGLLLLLGYLGHLAIHFYAYPRKEPGKQTENSKSDSVKEDRPNISITSHDQRGGFTGINQGTVNLAPGLRQITPEQETAILGSLASAPKGKVEMTCIETDQEAVAFLRRIEDVLKRAGYEVNVWLAMMLSGPKGAPVGLIFTVKDATAVPTHAQSIIEAFARAGLNPLPSTNPDRDANTLYIVVGARPIEQ